MMAQFTGQIILYETEDGRDRIECHLVDETIWLSQALLGEHVGVSLLARQSQLH